MRELTKEVMERLLEEYGRVIYAAMKGVGMYQSNQQFDDYYQLGCLKLFEAYETCAQDPLLEENRYQFVNYAGQRIKWAFIDEKRREKYLGEHEEFQKEEAPIEGVWVPAYEEELAFKEAVADLVGRLNEKEKSFLWDRLYLGMNMSEIAKKRKVSRKTVHAWRKKVQEKVSTVESKRLV